MISVAVPTFNSTGTLDVCIRSFLETSTRDSEIVIVVDGTLDLNRQLIERYKGNDKVKFFVLDKNHGMCTAQNIAVKQCRSNRVLVINDDHIFHDGWEEIECLYDYNSVVSFRTIEFKECPLFGNTPNDFNFSLFRTFNPVPLNDDNNVIQIPFLINKFKYIAIGGFDPGCENGMKADCDFYLRCRIVGLNMIYSEKTCFYHFSMTTVNDINLVRMGKTSRTQSEINSFNYLTGKWGVGRCPSRKNRKFSGMPFLFSDVVEQEEKIIR